MLGARSLRDGRIRLSLSNRLALLFSAIVLMAFAVLYLYVAPGLQTRLLGDQLAQLASDARTHSGAIARTVGTSVPLSSVQNRVLVAVNWQLFVIPVCQRTLRVGYNASQDCAACRELFGMLNTQAGCKPIFDHQPGRRSFRDQSAALLNKVS